MKEKNAIMSDAAKVIAERKSYAEKQRDERLEKIAEWAPEYKALKEEFTACGIKLSRLAIQGKIDSEEFQTIYARMSELDKAMTAEIEKAGFPADYLDNVYVCSKCKDTGSFTSESGETEMCSCLKCVFGKLLVKESGIPVTKGYEAYNLRIFAENEQKNAQKRFDELMAMIKNFPNGANCLVTGKTGVGKTYNACIIGTELAKSGKQSVYVTMPDLMRTLTYFGDDEKLCFDRDTMGKVVRECDYLIIDELGAEKLSDTKLELFTSIIDSRLSDETKGTRIITNHTLKELFGIYGERVFSRLSSMKIENLELESDTDLRRVII